MKIRVYRDAGSVLIGFTTSILSLIFGKYSASLLLAIIPENNDSTEILLHKHITRSYTSILNFKTALLHISEILDLKGREISASLNAENYVLVLQLQDILKEFSSE